MSLDKGSLGLDMAIIPPTLNSGTSCEYLRQLRKASDIGLSPVGKPVLATTTREKRAGFWATRRNPINPPQS